MIFKTSKVKPVSYSGDTLVAFIGKREADGTYVFDDGISVLDAPLNGQVMDSVRTEEYNADVGSIRIFNMFGSMGVRRLIISGLGDPQLLTRRDFHKSVAAAARQIKDMYGSKVGILLPNALLDRFGTARTCQGVTEGMILGMYEFSRYKKATSKPGDISEVSLLVSPSRVNETHSGIVRGQQLSDAVSYARDLVNESPSVTTPSYLAREAERIGKYSPNISVTVYGKEQIKTLGMGGLLGVSQGSDQEPKFIRMDYGTRSNPDLVLIGKGITFDTGGLSLKPSSGMETMKLDMAGAASILGVFAFLATAKPKLSVTGLIAASENMPSGSALKPGDIIRIMNGTTVEVLNTDAEGRLILADALSYAEKHLTPKTIIDIATLTGACMVALGEDVAGVFSNSDELHQELKNASVEAGELMWPLPLVGEYSIQLKSHVADLKNISKSKYGGAVTAALFLREFVSGRTRWAHIDIAGPAYAEKDSPFRPEGGTGYATATLIEYILARSGR